MGWKVGQGERERAFQMEGPAEAKTWRLGTSRGEERMEK